MTIGYGSSLREQRIMDGQIAQAQWSHFLNDLVKTSHGYEAQLEIIGRDLGDQEEAAWLPFTGISYDAHHQQMFVTVGGISSRYPVHLTHMIPAPQRLSVRRTPAGEVDTLLIVSEDKTETLVHLRRQPQLTA
jgi:hypothetical protein